MSTLPNFPHKDQRTEATKDGKGPENGNYDCVPTSFASAIEYWDRVPVSGDELKDDEYSDAYQGGTALPRYVDQATDKARAIYHVTADSFNGTPDQLVATIHAWVDAGYPVIATIPSAWGSTRQQLGWNDPANPGGWTHVVVFFSTGNGSLTAMNPWGGFDHSGSDQYWIDRLCFNQVWKVHKEEMAISTNGLGPGFAAYVQQHQVAAKCVSGGEVFKNGWSYATFENGLILYYDPSLGVRDNAGNVVVDRLNQEINAANASVKDRDGQISQLQSQLTQESTDLTQARADLATCLAQPKGLSDAQKQALGVVQAALKPFADAFAAVDAAEKAA